jgi:hypothetical protein
VFTVNVVEHKAPKPYVLASGWPAPRQPSDADDTALLSEAIRFHAYSDPKVVRKGGLVALTTEALRLGLPVYRRTVHDALYAYLRKLAAGIKNEVTADQILRMRAETRPDSPSRPVRKSDRTKPTPPLKRDVYGPDLARLAVRSLLSADWRDPARFAQLLAGKKRPDVVRARSWERLTDGLRELGELVSWSNIRGALEASFGGTILAPWGGDRVVERPGREPSIARSGYTLVGRHDVGLTEKLYEEFATTPFKVAHNKMQLARTPIAVGGGAQFTLHHEVVAKMGEVRRALLPPIENRPKPFREWERELDRLQAMFGSALQLKDPRLVQLAVDVGLPWGIVLPMVLRAYLAQLELCLMMGALPIATTHRDADGSGLLAVALWEAHAGQRANHPQRNGYLLPSQLPSPATAASPTTSSDEGAPDAGPSSSDTADSVVVPADATLANTSQLELLLKVIPSWNVTSFRDRYGTSSDVHATTLQFLSVMEQAPLPLPLPEKSANVKPPDVTDSAHYTTSSNLFATWPMYPYMGAPGNRLDSDGFLQLNFAAHFTAQAHLFVAEQLLRVAIDDLGLSNKWSRRSDDATPAAKFEPPAIPKPTQPILTKAISVIAGSYWWNGRMPPHITHRDGATYDLQFGPHSVCWLPVEIGKEFKQTLTEVIGKKKGYTDPESVCLTWDQVDSKLPIGIVFRGLVTAMLADELKRVKAFLPMAITRTELSAHAEVEKRLAGTPHFFNELAAQQITAGHVALLLSAPTQIIFSSPITHLRSMRAIRLGLKAAGIQASNLVFQLVSSACVDAWFVFKPADHHNHWHIQYGVKNGGGTDPTLAYERFKKFLPLYAALGVDLAPFAEYLEGVQLNEIAGQQYAGRIAAERTQLLELFARYRPDTDGRTVLQGIFGQLAPSLSGSLIAPANTSKPSAELKRLIDESGDVLQRTTIRLGVKSISKILDEITEDRFSKWLGDLSK